MSEEWKDIKGYEGLYQVSNWGRVRSLDRAFRDKRNGRKVYKGKILKQHIRKDGYHELSLCNAGVQKTVKVHQLVLETFTGKKAEKNKLECRHLNGDKSDNRLANICWGNQEENYQDRRDHGTENDGTKNGRAILTVEQVLEIRNNTGVRNNPKLAEKYVVDITTIQKIRNGKLWKYLDEPSIKRQKGNVTL